MELVSLDIERFGRIARAGIGFKPGLNVLHGANEAGKSSIAQAIRFALLLPSSSSAAEPWIPWGGGGDPMVTLVFRNGADYYRVTKVFGTSTASLERSSDGSGWANPTRGREVEARLRSLLQWGIPEPGGAKAPKGLPESFLASALLADQDHVANIFEQDLDGDGVDSGRVRVRAALQAMAQDPLFKSVLDAAQARVDEAFTSNGGRKRGAGDPFKKMAEEVAKRQRERDEAEQAVTTGRVPAQRVKDLRRDTAQAESDLHEKAAQREALERRRARQITLAKAADERKKGQARVDAVTEAEKNVKAADDVLDDVKSSLAVLRKAEEDARQALEAETAFASAARERRKGELAQEEAGILRERDALRTRQARLALAHDLRKAGDLHQQGEAIEKTLKTLDSEIVALEAVEPWTELQTTKVSLETAIQREATIVDLLTKATELRSEAATEWPASSSNRLPDGKRLDELRGLCHRLDLAEAKLDVGLSVEVRGAPAALVSVDGAAKKAQTSPFAVQAQKAAELDFGGGIEVVIRGGQAAHRAEAERLHKEWHDGTKSLFASVGVTDFLRLEDACRLDAEKKARAETLMGEAAKVDAERTALGNPAGERVRFVERIADLEGRIQGTGTSLIEAAAKAHGSKPRAALSKRIAERESKRSELAQLRGQESALRERSAPSADGTVIEDVDAEARALARAAQDLDRREREIDGKRTVLDGPPLESSALDEVAKKSKQALEVALATIVTATSDHDSWSARLQERRMGSANVDITALTREEEAARTASSNDGALVEESALAEARNAEETARIHHEGLLGELRKAEGALQACGGAAADEKLRELEDALQRACEKQATVEDEYEAWKLLAETLKDAERTQATHLGNVLAPELAARLQALAGERYSGIALSPHLRLEGIDASGGQRELERLSIGTREQISTLFRLCLAERLRSALLLDDQLVQSDPDRLRWFRRALRQTAATGVQVVVLTCRPDDYLESAETPPPHVIDLGTVITV
ncbi:MAG TPA: AAA family ATPase [Polyangia bacterium]|nr:AAA family ATPase [Polyangia bacterium]